MFVRLPSDVIFRYFKSYIEKTGNIHFEDAQDFFYVIKIDDKENSVAPILKFCIRNRMNLLLEMK